MGGYDGEFVGAGVGAKPNFSPTSPIFKFFHNFISNFSHKNGYIKFQLLKLSIKKARSRLFCYVQYKFNVRDDFFNWFLHYTCKVQRIRQN